MNWAYKRGLGLIVLATACSCASYRPALYSPSQALPADVYLTRHDWHAGIVVAGEDVRHGIPALAEDFRTARYIEFGWGEAEFYPAREETSRMALKAAFLPNDSVLHVVGFDEHPQRYFGAERVQTVTLSRLSLERLLEYIGATVALTEDGRALRLGEGLYGDSRFYQANGVYHLFNNCNTWTAQALHAAGLPVRSAWVFTAADILEQVKDLQ